MTRQSRSSLLILVGSSAFVLIAIVAAAIFISQNPDGSKGDAATPATQVPTKGTGYQAETPATPIATSTITTSPSDTPVIPPATPSQTVPTIPPPTPNPPTLTIPIAVLPEEPVCRYVKVRLENPADLAELHRLSALGLKLLEKLDKKVWYGCIESVGGREPTEIEGVALLEPIDPADKLSDTLRTNPPVQEWEVRPNGRRAFTVLFHKGVSAGEVQKLADDHGFELEEYTAETFGVTRVATIVVDPGGLQKLIETGIISFVDITPPPNRPMNNRIGQQLSKVGAVHAAPFNLDGTGVTVGVWDGGQVLSTHVDMSPRINTGPGNQGNVNFHATHVGGTIASSGANDLQAQGMAPNARIESYDWFNDNNEIITAARSTGVPPRVTISNHSYGRCAGWCSGRFRSQAPFGSYDVGAGALDDLIRATGIISSWAAGNARSVGPNPPNNPAAPNNCTQHQFDAFAHAPGIFADCILQANGAKNVITVGAMADANRMAWFSSYGPMDDGRIKPDIVAAGNPLYSTWHTCNTCYNAISGTSMATPLVTGIGTLIVQDLMTKMNSISSNEFPFRRIWTPMTPEGMKALLAQTADDVQGFDQATVGPDYASGWGIANAQSAITLVRKGGLTQGRISATGLGNAWSQTFNVTGAEPEIHMTLAWSDPAGNPAAAKALVNDLDLRLIDPNGTEHTPWILPGGMADPTRPAIRNGGNDDINNVEQVSVLNPAAGRWTVRVTASDLDPTTVPQIFALAGLLPDDPDTILSPIRLLP